MADVSRKHFRKSRSFYSTLLKLFFILFLFTNGLLFYFLYDHNEPSCTKKGTCRAVKKSRTLPLEKWGQTIYFKILLEKFQKVNNEWRLISRLNSKTDVKNELNCSSLHRVHDLKFIAAGWTKSAYKVTFNDTQISMKVVNIDGHDMSSCMQEEDRYHYDCFLIAASKLIQEISVLYTLSHPNVIKVTMN